VKNKILLGTRHKFYSAFSTDSCCMLQTLQQRFPTGGGGNSPQGEIQSLLGVGGGYSDDGISKIIMLFNKV